MKKILFLTSIIAAVIVGVFYNFNIDYTKINFKDILSSTVAMGSIGIGFLAAAVTLMPAQQTNPFLKELKRIGGYSKMLNSLVVGIGTLFITCLLSIFGLFFDLDEEYLPLEIFYYVWLFVFVISIFSVGYVIWTFLFYLRSASDSEDIH
ncbi:hypothetical protein JMA_22050 [Jeotgalibacillus malaysiensis]|uniref:Uncharacterized protein n=1 Tax=Jeotgalibacillus malaysiensis TaxID=1508404 RepID=A0A0B5AS50_9BACL|nr:hypothetical protein [Jeotgalibacillus malaysiensis]AJD91522.1 hypothetical protein JMA_22050 [Jeotgalibacillus malaysiensis]